MALEGQGPEFAITKDKLTVDADRKTITFELHLFKQLALTLPTPASRRRDLLQQAKSAAYPAVCM